MRAPAELLVLQSSGHLIKGERLAREKIARRLTRSDQFTSHTTMGWQLIEDVWLQQAAAVPPGRPSIWTSAARAGERV